MKKAIAKKKAPKKAASRKTYADRVAATYAGKSVTPKMVSDKFGIDRGNACRILQSLCAKGLATQSASRRDYKVV